MKISRIVLAVLFALAASANTLRAVPLPTFSFHEDGQGKLELPGGVVIPFPGVLKTDTGPGGLTSALAFTAHPLAKPFPFGDVVLQDASGHVSDILRFDEANLDGSQLIFFYSNDHGGLLADNGLPS